MGEEFLSAFVFIGLLAFTLGVSQPGPLKCAHPLQNTKNTDILCGNTLTPELCPENYFCSVNPADAWAVCCPDEPVCLVGEPVLKSDGSLLTCDSEANTGCPDDYYECVHGRYKKPSFCCLKQAGECPEKSKLSRTCDQQCGAGAECPPGKICCYNGCGHECVAAEAQAQVIVDPCESLSCQEGTKCAPQEVVCESAPCRPIPGCIPAIDPCVNKVCGDGKHCIAKRVQCVSPPCKPQAECVQDKCYRIPDSGPCYAHIEQWHFNSYKGHCETFIYGGCEGNDNRFDSPRACVDACGGAMPIHECKQNSNQVGCGTSPLTGLILSSKFGLIFFIILHVSLQFCTWI